VPFGILLALVGILGFTQVTADTPSVELALALFVVGLGIGASMMPAIGASMMPAISAAYQTLHGPQVVNASRALNVMQRVGGSIGSALMAVALARFTASQLPGAGGGVVGRRGEGELPPAIAGHRQRTCRTLSAAEGATESPA